MEVAPVVVLDGVRPDEPGVDGPETASAVFHLVGVEARYALVEAPKVLLVEPAAEVPDQDKEGRMIVSRL